MKTISLLTVDPGLTGTGLAAWTHGGLVPVHTQVIIHPPTPSWIVRAGKYVDTFLTALSVLSPEVVVIEDQSIWESSAKTRAAALRGDIIKLAHLTGMLMQATWDFLGSPPMLVSVQEWKGQLPKPAVDSRIWRCISKKYPDHVSDAVGIGLYRLGKF